MPVRGMGDVLMMLIGRIKFSLKNIRRGWGQFSRFTRFEVVDGSKIRL